MKAKRKGRSVKMVQRHLGTMGGAMLGFLVTLAIAGCGAPTPYVKKDLPSAVVSRQTEVLDQQLLQAVLGEHDGEAYRVGPGDSLLVAVYGHPELSLSPYAGGQAVGQGIGFTVDRDGTMQVPLVGSLKVAGKTSAEIRDHLERELVRFVSQPRVTVQVMFAGSIRYHLVGQFTNPGLKHSDRPMQLLQALSLGGSIQLGQASLRGAYVAREGKRLPVNFRRLILDGDLSQNIRLRTGDVIVVPDTQNEQAFVFAGSDSSRGGVVPFANGRLSVVQALAAAGFGYRDVFQGALSDTRVIRSEGDRAELYIVDVEAILDGDAGPFELEPGDVVFVPSTGLTDWNQVLAALLPSLQLVSGVLNPFVQIRYLEQTSR